MPRGPYGRLLSLALLVVALSGCDRGGAAAAEAPARAGAERSARATRADEREGGPRRIVAIGDLHGDLGATRAALRLAGAIDDRDRWAGDDLVVVQTGDRVDRGDDEPAILALFDRLAGEARAAGGAVHALLGNHELMNVVGDLRYVTRAGFEAYASHAAAVPEPPPPELAAIPPFALGRALAFRPGGPVARALADGKVALRLGRTVFVHGGLLPSHARGGLDTLNAAAAAFLRGEGAAPEALVASEDSPVWTRRFSVDPGPADCAAARESLGILGATRMVVGHTVQERGITAYCDGAVFAIDVGMSAHYGGPVEVLEIEGGRVRPLRERARAARADAVQGAHDDAR